MYHCIMRLALQWEWQGGLKEEMEFIFGEQFKQSDQVQAAWSYFVDLAMPEIKPLLGGRPHAS
jgi:hypothetical protein